MSWSIPTRHFGVIRIAFGSAVVLAIALSTSQALASDTEPSFDAASIKVVAKMPLRLVSGGASVAMPFQGWTYTPGRVTCVLTLRDLIKEAFDVKGWQISGSDVLDGDYQSLEAVMPPKTTRSEARLMLRSLLQARYQLRFHMEQKVLPSYALIVDKGGLKIKPLTGDIRSVRYGNGNGRFFGNGVT